MITWGSCVAHYRRAADWLLPGLARNATSDDEVLLVQDTSIARAYNRILAASSGPTVLLHDDTELFDGARDAIVSAFDRGVDVVGAIGSAGGTQLAWWKAPVRRGTVGETRGTIRFGPPGPVDAVDGLLIGLRTPDHRFDVGYRGFHGYDRDICSQATQRGMTVEVAAIPLHHHTKGGFGDRDAWREAERRWSSKWRP